MTLVIFAIRTRRVPFFSSYPSLPLTLSALGIATVGALLPATPVAWSLGFQLLPFGFFAALAAMVVGYLVLIEWGKHFFYRAATSGPALPAPPVPRRNGIERHLHRRAAYFSTAGAQPAAPEPRR